MSDSTANRFIRVMARINAIAPENEEPMRHAMRQIRNVAITIIDNALAQAEALTFAADDLPEVCAAAIADADRLSSAAPAAELERHKP